MVPHRIRSACLKGLSLEVGRRLNLSIPLLQYMGQSPSQPVSPEGNSSRLARDMTNLSYLSSSSTLHEELTPSHERTSSEQHEWNAWTRDDGDKGTTSLPNPFTYGSPIPADVKPKNVVLFGETGVGKSSVINLMAGAEVARTSANLQGCTMRSREYPFILAGETPFRIYDTVGLNEPDMGVNTFMGAIEKAHKLVTSLHNAGGIDLLVFCIRGNRITGTVQRNYRLFFEILGGKQVPLAFVVTHLELEDCMENWWERNEQVFREYGIHSVAHACITAAPAHVTMYGQKQQESRFALQRMFHDAFSCPSSPFVQDVQSWFMRVIEFLRSILRKSSWFKKKELSAKLEILCSFSRDEAERLADILARR